MKIGVVRHAVTEDNLSGIMQGRRNVLLCDKGRRDTQELRKKLNDIKFDYCYTSPLARCVETAFILIGDKCEMIRDDRLLERDLGELEGKERSVYDVNKYWDYDLNSGDSGVESVRDVIDRVKSLLDYLKSKYGDDSHILIVTHGAPCRAIRLLAGKKELKGNLFDGNVEHTKYEEFEI